MDFKFEDKVFVIRVRPTCQDKLVWAGAGICGAAGGPVRPPAGRSADRLDPPDRRQQGGKSGRYTRRDARQAEPAPGPLFRALQLFRAKKVGHCFFLVIGR